MLTVFRASYQGNMRIWENVKTYRSISDMFQTSGSAFLDVLLSTDPDATMLSKLQNICYGFTGRLILA